MKSDYRTQESPSVWVAWGTGGVMVAYVLVRMMLAHMIVI